jgi:long-chain acyl-CoA synthetase
MPSAVPYPRVALTALLERAAREFPHNVACTLYDEEITYAQLEEQARRLARSLRDLGARKGRFVGLLLPNIPDYLVALQATWLTGATALQLSPLMVAEEVDHWLQATGCHVVVTLDLLAPAVKDSLGKGPLEHLVLTSLASRIPLWKRMLYRVALYRRTGYLTLPHDAHRHRFSELLHADPIEGQADVDPAEDAAVCAPTGGTTASPKSVLLTHRNLVSNAMQLRNWVGGEDGTDGLLSVLPFFHSYGLSVGLLAAWAKASTIHLYPRYETRAILNLLLRRRPALLPAVPAMLKALNQAMHGKHYDLSFIQAVISGASALDPAVRDEFRSYGVGEVVEGYGLTEASPVTHVNPPGTWAPSACRWPTPRPASWIPTPAPCCPTASWANWWCAARR